MSYIACVGSEKIQITYGFLAPIVDKGLVFPFEGLTLHNVLHVPQISYNLLSISYLTRELNYKGLFLPNFVLF